MTLACVVGCCCAAQAADMSTDSVALRLARQLALFPQEKVHLTTDKEMYMGGDTIWFRAWVVNAATHEPLDASLYVYVELRDQFNEVTRRVKIVSRNGGEYTGYIPLDVKIAEGRYLLTAYTQYMRNIGQDLFFKKSVTVKSPFSSKVAMAHTISENGKGSRQITVQPIDRATGEPLQRERLTITYGSGKIKNLGGGTDPATADIEEEGDILITLNNDIMKFVNTRQVTTDFDVTFHPEGGYLIPGQACKVAFKAIDSNGLGIDVEGIVTGSDGTEVSTIASVHRGMGMFTLFAQAGVKYKATVRTVDGMEKSFDLPEPRADACVLHLNASRRDTTIYVTTAGGDAGAAYKVIVVHRGSLITAGDIKSGETMAVRADSIPDGVAQFLLTDMEGNTLSERLVFCRKNPPETVVRTFNGPYHDRSIVTVEIDLTKYKEHNGSLAVSVTDNSIVPRDSSTNVLTQLLLQSELRGDIENPAYYFDPKNTDAPLMLDLLMMTQGWRRYDIPGVLRGEYATPTVPMEFGQLISGTLRSYWKNKPIADGKITVITKRPVTMQQLTTDADGHFYYGGLNLPDSTLFIIQAKSGKGKNEENLEIDEQVFPDVEPLSYVIPVATDSVTMRTDEEFLTKEYLRLNMSGVLSVMLDEVVVSAVKKSEAADILHNVMFDKSADYNYFEEHNINSYEQAIRKFGGVHVVSGNVTFRRAKVAFVVDGVVFDYESGLDGTTSQLRDLEAIAPFDNVKRIDFVLPGQAGVPGSLTGYGGVLLITTKDGTEKTKPRPNNKIKTVMPLGYQAPAQFYNPKYVRGYTGPVAGGDLRSTLYWNPVARIGTEGRLRFSFYANDSRDTTYRVTAEGVTPAGDIISVTSTIHKR